MCINNLSLRIKIDPGTVGADATGTMSCSYARSAVLCVLCVKKRILTLKLKLPVMIFMRKFKLFLGGTVYSKLQ